ncbi:hypothetical protein QBC34DRAFT_382262 [Podospora aff. communis PSN243]|uniref:Uncharacterized protein n=1 Tax=Podospora aff. communis PSN243 TaxID=3040156 RepID=A0AAV9GIV4_9PEZI|nr:hypothetical protein QBC34DRAFT_382262 [Podospora aff. communis PSN243]
MALMFLLAILIPFLASPAAAASRFWLHTVGPLPSTPTSANIPHPWYWPGLYPEKTNNGSLLDIHDRGVADCWHEPPGTKAIECNVMNGSQPVTYTLKPLLYCTGEQYGSDFDV